MRLATPPKIMLQEIALLLIVLIALMAPQTVLAKLSATVDRNRIGVDDTFRLTVSKNKASFFGDDPDLSPLNQDFKVLGRNQSSRHSIVNGKTESTTEWIISLKAKRTGNIVIPPIEVDGEKTDPIVMKVSQTAPGNNGQSNRIYAEAEFDQQDVYVQSQIIFTLRLVSAINLVDLNVEMPQIPQAFVEKLSDTTYEKSINGERFGVYEIKYAIFPQASGELTIPPLQFAGAVPQRRSRSFFDPFDDRGKAVRLRSPEANITVKEKPQSTGSSLWLPSKRFSLEESWSKSPDQLEVGESVTRTIKMTAAGLMAEQLPPIEEILLAGIKTYPDQAQTENQSTSTGMVSSRIQSTAILPTQAGTFNLPAIDVQWWDTNSEEFKIASLPARTIKVSGGVVAQIPQIMPTTNPGMIDVTANATNATQTANNKLTMTLALVASLFAIAWLITLFFYWRLHKTVQRHTTSGSENESAGKKTESEKQLFRKLTKYCKENNPGLTRQALIEWAKCYWINITINSLEEFPEASTNPELQKLLLDLDRALYGSTQKQKWSGESLIQIITELRKQPSAKNTSRSDLKPLYPISTT